MIHTVIFSCAELNAYIMIIYKSSPKSLGELVTHARTFYEEEKMAAKDGENCKTVQKMDQILLHSLQSSHLQLM